MGRPKGKALTRDGILDRIDDGFRHSRLDAVTIASVAKLLGIRPPSLYSHFSDLRELRDRIVLRGLQRISAKLRAAVTGVSGEDALAAFMEAYLDFARRHPLYFDAVQFGASEGRAGTRELSEEIVELAFRVLAPWKLSPSGNVHAVRILRSLLSGFALLERDGGFRRKEKVSDTCREMVAFALQGLKGMGR